VALGAIDGLEDGGHLGEGQIRHAVRMRHAQLNPARRILRPFGGAPTQAGENNRPITFSYQPSNALKRPSRCWARLVVLGGHQMGGADLASLRGLGPGREMPTWGQP
jgi:hypothetical protein